MEYQTETHILAIGRILMMLHEKLNSLKTELEFTKSEELRTGYYAAVRNTQHILHSIENICKDEELFTEQQLLCIRAMAELLHRDQEAREKAIAAYEQSLL